MARVARESMRHVGVMVPPELLQRIGREMRTDRRWLFGNRSRAIRALLEEALTARDEARAARNKEKGEA
jgi:hypothetical protein